MSEAHHVSDSDSTSDFEEHMDFPFEVDPYDVDMTLSYWWRTLNNRKMSRQAYTEIMGNLVSQYITNDFNWDPVRGFLSLIGHCGIESLRFGNSSCLTGLRNISELHISQIRILNKAILTGLHRLNNIESFAIASVHYFRSDRRGDYGSEYDVTESELARAFEYWRNLQSLKITELNGEKRNKILIESLLSASNQSLQRLHIMALDKCAIGRYSKNDMSLYPTLNAINPQTCVLKIFEFQLNSDNIDVTMHFCQSLANCAALERIVIAFASENIDICDENYAYCKPIANVCARALANSSAQRRELVFWDACLSAVDTITKTDFWDKSEPLLSNVVFVDCCNISSDANAIDGISARMQQLIDSGAISERCEFYSRSYGRDSGYEYQRCDMVVSVSDNNCSPLSPLPQSEFPSEDTSQINHQSTEWLQYIPEKYRDKVEDMRTLSCLKREELRDICKILHINPGGERWVLISRIRKFNPNQAIPAIYNHDMTLDDFSDEEPEETEQDLNGFVHLINMLTGNDFEGIDQ